MAKLDPIRCPNCKKRYRLPASLNNKQVVCKRCQHEFRIEGHAAESDSPDTPMPGSIFDALDVDNLLSAPSSGLEKAKPKRKPVPQAKRKPPGRIANNVEDEPLPKSTPAKKPQPHPLPEPSSLDPNPELIEDELEFAWAKKRKQKNEAKTQQRAVPSKDDAKKANSKNLPELDDEELAIYAAVTRQNRRRNFFCAVVAAAVVVLIGGFFANLEYENLSIPLTVVQREWLTDRGFMLKARRVANINGDEGAAVLVSAGKSFDDIDQFSAKSDDTSEVAAMDPNRLRNGQVDVRIPQQNNRVANNRVANNRNERKNVGEETLPLVDFDTQVNPARASVKSKGADKAIVFSTPAVLASSPRGQFYAAGAEFIKVISSSGEVIEQRTLELPSGFATAIAATSDGRRVIVGGDLGEVQSYVLDAKGRLIQEWTKRIHRDKIIHLLTSSDSKLLVVYSAEGAMKVLDLESQSVEVSTSDLVPQERLESLRLIKDTILISSSDGIRKFQISDSSLEREAFDRGYRMLSPDTLGEKIVYSDGPRLGVFDAETKRVDWNRTMRIANLPRIKFSPDRTTAFYYDGGRSVLHFEIASGRLLHRFGDDRLENAMNLGVSSDGKLLLVSGAEDRLYLFAVPDVIDVVQPKVKPPLPAIPRNYPPIVAENQPGDKVVANVTVTPEKVSAMCLSGNGFLIAATESGPVVVYDWTKSRVVYERFESNKDAITFMTTLGNQLLLGRESGLIEASEISPSGKLNPVRQIIGQSDRIKFIGMIPDSSDVVSVTESGHTHVWDLQTGAVIYDGQPLKSRIRTVAIDRRSDVLLADGDELVTLDYKSGAIRKRRVTNGFLTSRYYLMASD